MRIKIISEDGLVCNAALMLENGMPLRHVQRVDICMDASDGIVTAQLVFSLPGVNVVAEATVSEDHLHELAGAHGYDLVKKGA